MKLSSEERNQLVSYRFAQARECIEEVTFLIHNKKYKIAINRVYYGMFYALLALGLKYEFETSKHFQLLGWFNNTFIRTGKIDIEFGKMINKAYSIRQESDYEPFVNYEEQEVTELFRKMKVFIDAIETVVNKGK